MTVFIYHSVCVTFVTDELACCGVGIC